MPQGWKDTTAASGTPGSDHLTVNCVLMMMGRCLSCHADLAPWFSIRRLAILGSVRCPSSMDGWLPNDFFYEKYSINIDINRKSIIIGRPGEVGKIGRSPSPHTCAHLSSSGPIHLSILFFHKRCFTKCTCNVSLYIDLMLQWTEII